MVVEGTLRQAAEFATFRIGFDLAIPDFGVVALEPRTQRFQLGCAQFSNLQFQLLQAIHRF